MRVQTTKKMASELNKRIPENSSIYGFITWSRLSTYSDSWNDMEYNDDGELITKIIKVIYKPECYAMDNELTTSELRKIFKRSGVSTIDEYASAVIDYMEI